MMENLHQKALDEAAQASQAALAALFNATTLFERVVWLVRRYAQLLLPQRVNL